MAEAFKTWHSTVFENLQYMTLYDTIFYNLYDTLYEILLYNTLYDTMYNTVCLCPVAHLSIALAAQVMDLILRSNI